MIKTSSLFDLTAFSHRAIFRSEERPWEVLGAIGSYLKSYALGKIEIEIPEGVFLENPELISIGEGSVVEPGSFIRGPCILGKNCSVRHGAYIRGNLIAGDHCVIGHASEVKNALFLDHAQAAHFAYVGDSVLGNRVNLGAGTKLANLKLNHHEISIIVDGQLVKTGLRKFGALLGDDAQLGCNSVTNPGTILGQGSFWYPCTANGGVFPPKSRIKSC